MIFLKLISTHIIPIVYKKSIENKNLSQIQRRAKVYYSIDKFFHIITNILNFSFTLNIFKLFKNVIALSKTNILIITLLAIHLKLYEVLTIINLPVSNAPVVNACLSILLFILSYVVVLLFKNPILQSKARKKINENIYDTVMEKQLLVPEQLNSLLIKMSNNISELNRCFDYHIIYYCEELTNHKFTWKDNALLEITTKRRNLSYPHLSRNEPFEDFNSYSNEINELNTIFKDISKSHYRIVFFDINKFFNYELFKLEIYPSSYLLSTNFKNRYLNKDFLLKLYKSNIENDYLIQDTIKNFDSLSSHEIESLKIMITDNVNFYKYILRKDFEETILYSIIGKEFNNYLTKKNKLNLIDWILTKIA